MFKKLKEKITEEVKISPQRFAEFTQSVSDRLQNSSTSDDNFFSIGEDDANNSVDNNSYGFSSVQLVSPSQERTRKNSTSSLASDVSFLPRYEPGSMYHLQSDLDISASELEDNVSTASSQLGHLSKEQIYSAFQKAQMRYHKYRGRYTDLSRHYKDLERENTKMKGVLVETQDKAIRRVTELKEQCSLEQKAKAHLESALRDDIDEKNYKIKSLQTKIGLLQNEGSSNSSVHSEENGNNPDNLENLTKYLNDSRKEIENLNAKIQELKANAIVFQSKEHEYKSKISNLEKEIFQFSEREKENNLNLAQNKMELHNEILLKDAEISNLKRDIDNLKVKLESSEVDGKFNQKMDNLQNQNTKLIEKVEALTQKSNNLENELIKMETFKIEIHSMRQKHSELEEQVTKLQTLNEELNKSKLELEESLRKEKENYESQISSLREDAKKGLLSLEPKIREKLQVEFSKKEEQLREEFNNKIEQMSSTNNTSKEIQLDLFEKETIITKMSEELDEIKSELTEKTTAYSDLEKNHLDLIEDCTKLRDTIANLEKDKLSLDSHEEKVSRLESHIHTLQEELEISQKRCERAEKELASVKQSLASTIEQLKVLEEKNMHLEDSELKLKHLEKEKENLNQELESLKRNSEDKSEKNRNLDLQLEEMQEKLKSFETKEALMKMKEDEVALKLMQLEETLRNNIESVEKEHISISQDLDAIRNELNLADEDSFDQFTHGDVKSKLIILKDMCTQKNEQYNGLLQKQLDFERKKDEMETLQSKIRNIQTENYEFQAKIKDLETDLNENHILLEEKETELRSLIQNKKENSNRISELEDLLSSEKTTCSNYLKENGDLANQLKELDEKYKLILSKEEGMEIEKTEYDLVKLKLQNLEEEYQRLQQSFAEEKESFGKTSKENKEIIIKLENNNLELNDKYENALKENLKKIQEKQLEIGNLTDQFNKEMEEKDQEICELSTNISNLSNTIDKQKVEFNDLLSKTEQLDIVVQKMKTEKDHAMKMEKDQEHQHKLQINELRTELDQKLKALGKLEDMYKNHQEKYEEKVKEVADLEAKLTADLKGKDQEIYILNAERDSLLKEITTLKGELEDFNREISQKGNIEIERETLKNEITELYIRIQQLSLDNRSIIEENQSLSQEKEELKIALEFLKQEQSNGLDKEKLKMANVTLNNTIEDLSNQLSWLQEENSELKSNNKLAVSNELDISKIQQDFYEIKAKCDDLFVENKNLKLEYSTLEEKCDRFGNIKEKLETQISDLEQHYNELLREKQLLEDEVQELKTSPVNYKNDSSKLNTLETLKESEKQNYLKEVESLREKLIKYKSLDLTNKSSIEFYENELQKMKNQNDKLNRKLDETLVTLNHCAELSTSTEVEYLKNVLYNYMLGKESLVLARVIAAVCKFDPQQTEVILQKEQQKQTLLGQLGLI